MKLSCSVSEGNMSFRRAFITLVLQFKLGQFFEPSAAHLYPNIVRVTPGFLETPWLEVNQQEDDSVIFQINPFTNLSMAARNWDN